MPGELSPLALTWVEAHLGEAVVEVRRLTGGWTSAIHLIRTASGQECVLRLMDKDPWRRHGAGLIGRESDVQRMLAPTSVPAPTSIATDPTGTSAGHPAHLMSRLPGRLELRSYAGPTLDGLAQTLADIHAYQPDSRPRDFQSWATEAKRVVPEWASSAALWSSAFAALDTEPAYTPTFIHRDFHLGNVLWEGDEVSGVVDWVETSWGPAELDVAHCRTYLAMLHGPDVAIAFQQAYAWVAPAYDVVAQRFWDVMDIVGYLPDPVKVAQPWRDNGIDVSDETARRRLEQHLEIVLASSPS